MQAIDRVRGADMLPPLFCEPCRKVHVLAPENRLAFDVFMACRSQQIRSEGVLLGLDHHAIRDEVAERVSRAEDRIPTYRKVLAAERELVEWASEERARLEKQRELEAKRPKPKRN